MSLTSTKKIVRISCDIIPMPQTVIDRVNLLGKDQPELFIFTDHKGQPIGDVEDLHGAEDLAEDDDVELPGVPGGIETHQDAIPEMDQTEININDLNINEANPMIDTKPGIEINIILDANQEVEPAPVVPVPGTQVEATPLTTVTPDKPQECADQLESGPKLVRTITFLACQAAPNMPTQLRNWRHTEYCTLTLTCSSKRTSINPNLTLLP
jgi:hypothetical protein